MVSFLKRLLHREPTPLAPYVLQCIMWFGEQLPDEGRAILNAQVEAHDGRGHTDLSHTAYLMIPEKTKVPLFPNRAIDLCVARLMVKDNAGELIKCDLIFHTGTLYRIVFGALPKERLDGAISLSGMEIYHDLMSPDTRLRKPPAGPVPLPDKLKTLPIEDLAAPADEEAVAKFARRFAPSLPPDYVELLKLTDGFTLNGWEVNGLRTWDVDYDEGIFPISQRATISRGKMRAASRSARAIHLPRYGCTTRLSIALPRGGIRSSMPSSRSPLAILPRPANPGRPSRGRDKPAAAFLKAVPDSLKT